MSKLTCCFISNFLNHHQLPFCLEMVKLTEGGFTFIETSEMPEDRKRLGYEEIGDKYDFVVSTGKGEQYEKRALELALSADIVITGSAPDRYIRERMRRNLLTFRYSERIFKKGERDIARRLKYTLKCFPYRKKKLYYLFSSAYAAKDYSRCTVDPQKMLKWGYFPAAKQYADPAALLAGKAERSMLWAGRFLDWKHPELAVEAARRLKAEGYTFTLDLIGSGPLEEQIRAHIAKAGVEDRVRLLGPMPPEKVRKHMERSQIFLFTSDLQEGWGAVLNESMNSGCAVLACDAIGSVPFLMRDGENGFSYPLGDFELFYNRLKTLLDSRELCERLGMQAYLSMATVWNARNAATRLVKTAEGLLYGGELKPADSGPCSLAEIYG